MVEAIRYRKALALLVAVLCSTLFCCAMSAQAYALEGDADQQGEVASAPAADSASTQNLEGTTPDSLGSDDAVVDNNASDQADDNATKEPEAEGAPAESDSTDSNDNAGQGSAGQQQESQEPAEGVVDTQAGGSVAHVNMFRLYNPYTGEHFYTSDEQEAMDVAAAGWQWEGIGWVAPTTSSDPVYRLYNPFVGDHHYTLSKTERDDLVKEGWIDEGIGWYSDGTDQLPIYREYNPNAVLGSHNFTASKSENDYLVSLGWKDEGTAWFATKGVTVPFAARWLVAPAWGTMQRYWIDGTGSVAKSRYIDAAVEGSGWNAYAKPDGAVVCGKWDNGAGHVYVADSKGELAKTADGKTGWFVTDAYDNCLQRYYYDAAAHAMKSGFFTVDGNNYLGMPNEGYVLRGKTGWANHVLLANNDGVMAANPGWLVTDLYDGRNERYWLEAVVDTFVGAVTGYFWADGNRYYAFPDAGCVLRNYLKDCGDAVCWADNDGVLTYYCNRCCDDPYINERIANVVRDYIGISGNSLRRAYDWVVSFRYISGSKNPTGDWAPGFAMEMLNNGGGNCYRFAALFCCLARALGYSSGVVAGYVNGAAGGLLPHGWTEIYTSTGTRVCDPDLQHEIPSRDWYWRTYSNSPTVYYF